MDVVHATSYSAAAEQYKFTTIYHEKNLKAA